MRIAFYAPLKPPDHAIPSGDRRMAQLFYAALRLAGHEPLLASRLRSYDGAGDRRRQDRLAAVGGHRAARFLKHCRAKPEAAPHLWFTYHLYHKAPDWLGPAVARALGIPYVVAEASWAPKRAGGPWDAGHRAVASAIRQADAVIGLNPSDRDCVLPLLRHPARWAALKPFLDTAPYDLPRAARPGPARLVALAMMRHGDKLASYRVLGRALARLLDQPWSLEVIGGGPARAEVAAALAPLRDRVVWAGELSPDQVPRHLAMADLCVWPAVNEAFGMALLEAQAAGLPVVAGAYGGVREVVVPGVTGLLAPPGDAEALAGAVRELLTHPRRRARMGAAAKRNARAEHDLAVAAGRLGAVLRRLERASAA